MERVIVSKIDLRRFSFDVYLSSLFLSTFVHRADGIGGPHHDASAFWLLLLSLLFQLMLLLEMMLLWLRLLLLLLLLLLELRLLLCTLLWMFGCFGRNTHLGSGQYYLNGRLLPTKPARCGD